MKKFKNTLLTALLALGIGFGAMAQTNFFIKAGSGGSGSDWGNAAGAITTGMINTAGVVNIYMAAGDITQPLLTVASSAATTINIIGGFPSSSTGTTTTGNDNVANPTNLINAGASTSGIFLNLTTFGANKTITMSNFNYKINSRFLNITGASAGTVSVNNVNFSNRTTASGDYIAFDITGISTVTFDKCTFFDFKTAAAGSIIVQTTGTATPTWNITNCTFANFVIGKGIELGSTSGGTLNYDNNKFCNGTYNISVVLAKDVNSTVTNSTFSNLNGAVASQACVETSGNNALVDNCIFNNVTIEKNKLVFLTITLANNNATIKNSFFTNNTAVSGQMVYIIANVATSSSEMSGNVFYANTITDGGNITRMTTLSSNPGNFANNIFSSNIPAGTAYEISSSLYSNLTNNVFQEANTATNFPAASHPTMTGNTFGNTTNDGEAPAIVAGLTCPTTAGPYATVPITGACGAGNVAPILIKQ